MPKMKSHKAARKRFRMTASGRIRHRGAGSSHLLGCKSRKRKRKLRKGKFVAKADQKRIQQLL